MKHQEFITDSIKTEIMDNDYNIIWAEHSEKLRNLLLTGLPGFIIGFTLFAVNLFPHASGELLILCILGAVVMGTMCAGIPYGWKTLNGLLGQWDIYGSLFVVIACFILKLGFSMIIGMYAYPVVLIYHFIRSRKSNSKVRSWTIAVISIVTTVVLVGLIAACL